jgi:protein-L-isoaspartate O-methyltransferase
MAWRSLGEQNEEMVNNFKQMSIVTSKEVENAFLNVPRAAFLPEYLHHEAYADYPVRGDDHLHMSAPHMYATVLEALDLKIGLYKTLICCNNRFQFFRNRLYTM